MRILFAEDEKDLNSIITKALNDERYSVDSFYDGRQAIEAFEKSLYDAAILDVMMPQRDGYEVLKYIREREPQLPVLFLTARDAVEERVRGLDAGANDYLVKPFSLEELLARIRVMMRSSHNAASNLLEVADLTMDTTSHSVKRGDISIDLTAREYQLLEYLLINKGKVLSRRQIEDHIWNYDYEGGTNVVDVYIRYLRQKIDKGFERKIIHTRRGMGYVAE